MPQVSKAAIARLERIRGDTAAVVSAFDAGGFRLYLVGGSVRDAIMDPSPTPLGRNIEIDGADLDFGAAPDFDFTTDATPDAVEALVSPLAEALWLVGKRFGTVSARVKGFTLEITTHRGESYGDESRKPDVVMSTSLDADLVRRDFRINAMAVEFTRRREIEIIDNFGGLSDIAARILRTPGTPEDSFSDDPLRMLRAARFAARLEFELAPEVKSAMAEMAHRLEIVSRERIRDEFDKLITASRASIGLRLLVESGLADQFLPELPALALEQDPIHLHKDVLEHTYSVVDNTRPDLILRLAALFHDIGKPATRKFDPSGVSFHNHDKVGSKMTKRRMRELKYSSAMVTAVARLVYLHLRFHTYQAGWTDKAVRRYVVEAGDLLERLNDLTLADCTTRNLNKVRALEDRMVELKARIQDLRQREELEALRPELDGSQVMEILGLAPSREVGIALDFLLNLRLDEGLLGYEEARARLVDFWKNRETPSDAMPGSS